MPRPALRYLKPLRTDGTRNEGAVSSIYARADYARIRRFGAKPDKKICGLSSGEPEFTEHALPCNSDSMVVGVDRFWVVRAADWTEWLSGGEKGLGRFVSQSGL
jgi:hypothetical protein